MSMPSAVIFAVLVPRLKSIVHSVHLVRRPAEKKNHFESNIDTDANQTKRLIWDVRVQNRRRNEF